MTRHLFLSWQADTPTNIGRNFLRSVLDDVCKQLAADATLDEAARDVRVDSDTQGIPGQPPIAETILRKIDDAAVVVADMTFTGTRIDGRPTPNPNVLIEYGWALKSLGYSRVISVMNAAYGEPSSETLPFDLAHMRWPMRYSLLRDSSESARAEEKHRLTRTLMSAVQASLATLPGPVIPVTPSFSEATARDGAGRFRDPNSAVGFDDDVLSGGREVFLASGPAMWLRLMPTTAQDRSWRTKELLRVGLEGSALFPLRFSVGHYSYVRASDGQGIYRIPPDGVEPGPRATTASVAFAFRSGEVWSIDTTLLNLDEKRIFYDDIEETLVKAAERYRRFLQGLGVRGPYRWRAGLSGVKGRYLGFSRRPGYEWMGQATNVSDHIEAAGTLGEEQSTLEALLPFFNLIFEECGIERPDYLPKQ